MRQRKIKDVESKLAEYEHLIVCDPAARRGAWSAWGAGSGAREVYAEIGCGKGGFIVGLARLDPSGMYIGIEGQESVLLMALRAASDVAPPFNLAFIRAYAAAPEARARRGEPLLTECFAPGELSGIYLNFSDPWPKRRQEKRRLTSPSYLGEYLKVLRPCGFVRFRTDNEALFDYSLGSFTDKAGFELTYVSHDVYGDADDASAADDAPRAIPQVQSEYELRFRGQGKKIMTLEAVKK